MGHFSKVKKMLEETALNKGLRVVQMSKKSYGNIWDLK